MKCPKCGKSTIVTDSRERNNGIYRRRKCNLCGYRFSTYETIGGKGTWSKLKKLYRQLSKLDYSVLDEV